MNQPNQPTDAVVILYEVFTGKMPDGRQVMVQVFRRQTEDKSMMAQIAFREHRWETWGPPIRLDDMHQIEATLRDGA